MSDDDFSFGWLSIALIASLLMLASALIYGCFYLVDLAAG